MLIREQRILWFFFIYDTVLIAVSFLVSLYFKFGRVEVKQNYYLALPLVAVSWGVVTLLFTKQNLHFRDGWGSRLQGQLLDMLILCGLVSSVILLLNIELYSRIVTFGTIVGFFALRNLGYVALLHYLRWQRFQGRHVSNVLILGAGLLGRRIASFMQGKPELGYRVTGFLDDDPDLIGGEDQDVLGPLDSLDLVLRGQKVHEVFIALPLTVPEKIRAVVDVADFHGVRINLIPDYFRIFEVPSTTHVLHDFPIVHLREIPLDLQANKFIKRIFDVLFSLGVLILGAPVFVLLSIMIKSESHGPVFYIPERVGKGGIPFRCFKFRSMRVNESSIDNNRSTTENDSRITKVGAVMRRRSLDELPQFINVLMGEMSVVGPRPHRTLLNIDMQNEVEGYMIRHYVKPGVTGWAQVNGWRGPTDTFEQKLNRTSHDLWYLNNWNFYLDLRIIFLTLFGKKVNDNAF